MTPNPLVQKRNVQEVTHDVGEVGPCTVLWKQDSVHVRQWDVIKYRHKECSQYVEICFSHYVAIKKLWTDQQNLFYFLFNYNALYFYGA
jgi:hypothetical protein